MRVAGGRGTVRVRLDAVESQVLSALFTDLAEVTESDALEADDPVHVRLYPDGYRGDGAAADDFRELTEQSLRVDRAARARECAGEIDGPGDVVLDAEGGERWIQTLNDLRLTLGTRLEITDENDAHDVDPDDDQAQEWAVYHWLTALQDSIVRRLMR